MDKVLALGGYANGKWMPDYGPYLKVPIPSKTVFSISEVEVSTHGRMEIQSYTKRKLGDPATRNIAYAYVLDNTHDYELMDLLHKYLVGKFINGQGIYADH